MQIFQVRAGTKRNAATSGAAIACKPNALDYGFKPLIPERYFPTVVRVAVVDNDSVNVGVKQKYRPNKTAFAGQNNFLFKVDGG